MSSSSAAAFGVDNMPERLLAAVDPQDVRFQYEIIKGLAESIRQQTNTLADVQKTQVEMLIRLARIEENRVHEDVARNAGDIKSLDAKVDALLRDKDRRDGALSAWGWLARNWPWTIVLAVATALIAWAKQ